MKIIPKIFIVFTFLLAFVFVQKSQAQNNPYPNELKGYEFFGSGKLNPLRIGYSSKDEIKKIFGESCEKKCSYDEDWIIYFEYYEDIHIKENRNEQGEKLRYLLDSKYLGKLRSIKVCPKNQVSFVNVSFPNTFERLLGNSITDGKSGKSRMISYDIFQDSNGLRYEIYSETNYDDIKSKKSKSYSKGDLYSIKYEIPKELEKSMFVLQK